MYICNSTVWLCIIRTGDRNSSSLGWPTGVEAYVVIKQTKQ